MTMADQAGTTPAPGTYDLFHEAWYADACRPEPGSTETGRAIYINIGSDDAEHAIHIIEHRFPSSPAALPSLRVSVWDTGWAVFELAPALLGALARLATSQTGETAAGPTIESVKALLDELGFADTTKRQRPE